MLKSLPKDGLESLGIRMDMSIPRAEVHLPVGGRVSCFTTNWAKISQDPWILETVSGHRLELAGTPTQERVPGSPVMDPVKAELLSEEVQSFVSKGAITSITDDGDGYVNQLFLVPKSDGYGDR